MSGHPLERFADELKTFGAQRVAELDRVARPTSGSAASSAACAR